MDIHTSYIRLSKNSGGKMTPVFVYFGGDNRDRTGDLSLAKAALSHLSYSPNKRAIKFRLHCEILGR